MVGAGQRKIIDEEPPIGNGRAMAVLFAREGAHVACIDVNKEAADNTVAQITSEGGKAFADVRRRRRCRGDCARAWSVARNNSAGSTGWR